ncbi:hypothetical protein [Nitratidesulfovibrio liaohensis]|uniref:hypothetical protein n=1 Tax=Nitratidesulfovibrio liaohensis TaxID=2604158 RepID=UPI0014241A43|nr:hypothetical protein [Nitratidesulfovibrio liaohensis]NHZ47967.1 hypothetical protein [Nitratidesulfovibrio liaohensis]
MFNGFGIRCTDDKFVNLTDLWKASGATCFYGPSEWIRMELTVAGRHPSDIASQSSTTSVFYTLPPRAQAPFSGAFFIARAPDTLTGPCTRHNGGPAL